jgi:hypothetical protein
LDKASKKILRIAYIDGKVDDVSIADVFHKKFDSQAMIVNDGLNSATDLCDDNVTNWMPKVGDVIYVI